MKNIGIYGASGFAREVAWLLSYPDEISSFRVVAYIEDGTAEGRDIRGVPILLWEQFTARHPDAAVAIAIGDPKTREKLAAKCAGARFPRLVHPAVEMSSFVQIDEGTIICTGSILTVDIEIGRHVHINLDCTVGHDVRIGDFTTISPGVHVSGNVHIGRGVYIGTGANIINGTPTKPLVIGDGAVIGAGACITKDCEPRCLYAGVPAEVKKRY